MTAQELSQLGRHGLRPIVFVLNNSGYLSERMLCKDMALGYNDIAAWNYVELPHALGCQGWFTARVSSCGVLDDALKTASGRWCRLHLESFCSRHQLKQICGR